MLSLLFAGLSFATEICSDGWVSGSSGSGTCSHHGGIRSYSPAYVLPQSYSIPARVPVPTVTSGYPSDTPFGSSSQFSLAYEMCQKNPFPDTLFACRVELGTVFYLGRSGFYYGFIAMCDSYLRCKEYFERLGPDIGWSFDGESHLSTGTSQDGHRHFGYYYSHSLEMGWADTFDDCYLIVPQITFVRNCNVRNGPGTSYDILFTVKTGEKMDLEPNDHLALLVASGWAPSWAEVEGWMAVHSGDTLGYVSSICYQE